MPQTSRTVRTIAASVAIAAAATLALGGCVIPSLLGDRTPSAEPTSPAADPASPGTGPGSPTDPIDPNAPFWEAGDVPPPGVAPTLQENPELVWMTPELYSRTGTPQGITWARSTPGGQWQVGTGFPPEFPIGLPLYPDRWIKNDVLLFESDRQLTYSYSFWGGYAEVAAIMAELDTLGYTVEQDIQPTRQTHIAEGPDYRIVMTVAEGVKDTISGEPYDPQYTYIVQFKGVPFEEPED